MIQQPQWTFAAKRPFPAEILARLHYQGVVLIVNGRLRGYAGFKDCLDLGVAAAFADNPMPLEYAIRICVDDEYGLPPGIKEDAVRCFLADAVD
jgi:hypothetical protein